LNTLVSFAPASPRKAGQFSTGLNSHRYFFKLYALDMVLPDLKQPNKAALVRAMRGHTVGATQMMGTYFKGQ